MRVDLALGLLSEVQRAAGDDYSRLRAAAPGGGDEVNQLPFTWVPIARLSRKTVSPVEVVQADGAYVPRLTQAETGRLMAAAMYRLLRSILETVPAASDRRSELHALLHTEDESRWLMQRALMALTMERAIPAESHAHTRTPGTVLGPAARQRQLAEHVINSNSAYLDEYFRLLDVVLNDYMLVVALRSDQGEHSLSYSVPLDARQLTSSSGYIVRSLWQNLTRRGSTYEVSYSVPVSSTLRAYHLVADTQPDLTISSMFLASDADVGATRMLSADFNYLSARLNDWKTGTAIGSGFEKILEIEIQTAVRRLSEFVRRRQWEADHVGLHLPPGVATTCRSLHDIVSNGEATLDAEGKARSSLLHHPQITPDKLLAAASELTTYDLGWDLSAENDPATSRAHAYWRRPAAASVGSIDTTTLRCAIRIVDSSNVKPRNVALFLASVLGLKVVLAAVIFQTLSPRQWMDGPATAYQSDAVVAVLLLVPGFLYSRLDLPEPGSIAGILRAWARMLAYLAIANATLMSAIVAGTDSASLLGGAFAAGMSLDVLSLCVLIPEFQDHTSKAAGRPGAGVPVWALSAPTRSKLAVSYVAVGSRDGF